MSMPGYLGDKSENIVHHLGTMTQECNIYQIKKGDKAYFIPDTIQQALDEKFTQCKFCIKN